MQPPPFDLQIIRLLEPWQRLPWLTDAVERLSENPLANGFVFVVPLFLLWHFAEGGRRWLAQRLLLTVLAATVIGAAGSLMLQRLIRWPPPAANPAVAAVYSLQFRENPNPNSFPSDSTMLFSAVAFGAASWNLRLGAGLLAWLLLFSAPARVFVGGHYPSDILAGLLLGFCSLRAAQFLMANVRPLENLSGSRSPLLRTFLFLWLFEVGNGFGDVRDIVNAILHIQRHHL